MCAWLPGKAASRKETISWVRADSRERFLQDLLSSTSSRTRLVELPHPFLATGRPNSENACRVGSRLEVRHRLRLRLGILGKEKLISGKQLHDAAARHCSSKDLSERIGSSFLQCFVLGLLVLVIQA